jgi:hypothetical protein
MARSNLVFALALDLDRRPRLQRNGADTIQVHQKVQAGERERQLAVHTATCWGYKNAMLSHRQRMRIAQAACTQVAYNSPISWTRLRSGTKRLKLT